MLSFLATRSMDGYVPGINNILRGDYYLQDGTKALSAEEKMERGRIAIGALKAYHKAKAEGNETVQNEQRALIEEYFPYFGYGYVQNVEDLVPNVKVNYYAFRIMVGCGMLFILLFIVVTIMVFNKKNKTLYTNARWLHVITIICLPLVYLASQSGWIVAEMGRQPWAIQDILPLNAAVSDVSASSVMTTFVMFAILFTVLLIAEINIMIKAIKAGPKGHDTEGMNSAHADK